MDKIYAVAYPWEILSLRKARDVPKGMSWCRQDTLELQIVEIGEIEDEIED